MSFKLKYTLNEIKNSSIRKNIKNSFERLKERHKDSKSILGTAIMSNSNKEEVIDLTHDETFIELSKDGGYFEFDRESEAESQISHLDTYLRHKNRVDTSSDFIHSCMLYKGSIEQLVVLVENQGNYFTLSYNVKEQKLEKYKSNYALLNMIVCNTDTKTYFRQAAEIELLTKGAIELWCFEKKIHITNVRKICALLLIPKEKRDAKKMINDFLEKPTTPQSNQKRLRFALLLKS